ncbi:MAG: preprotein translocase subunit YajC [Thermodesulfobacteriota bacterium]
MNEGGGGALGPNSPLLQLAPFAMILVVFYFLLVRPQQRKARETQQMLDNLKVNEEVITTGGLYGRIVRLADKVVVIEIAPKVQVRIERSSVSQVVRKSGSDKGSEEKSA